MAKDVVTFLSWAAEPEHDERKKMGLQAVILLSSLLAISIYVKRFKWSVVKNRKICELLLRTNHAIEHSKILLISSLRSTKIEQQCKGQFLIPSAVQYFHRKYQYICSWLNSQSGTLLWKHFGELFVSPNFLRIQFERT